MPQFAELYPELDVPLPAITRILLDLCRVPLRNYFLVWSFAVAVVAAVGDFPVDALGPRRARHRPPEAAIPSLRRHLAEGADRAIRAHAFHAARGRHAAGCRRCDTSAAAIGSRLIATSVQGAADRVKEGQSLCTRAWPKRG